MKKQFTRHFVGFAGIALAGFTMVATGCASPKPDPGGSGGDNSGGVTGSGGTSKASGGSSTGSGGSISSTGGNSTGSGGSPTGSGGVTSSSGGSSTGSGGATSSSGGVTSSSGGSSTGSGGVTSSSGGSSTGSGGVISSSGGSSTGSGGTTGGGNGGVNGGGGSATITGGTTASTGSGTPKTTADIIGPGGAVTSNNKNGTHGDKWICLLNYPSAGENVTGAWFGYSWTTTACQTLTTPSSGGPPLCFKGGSCTGATPGAGLGFSLCDVHGVDVSTWPQMQQLITTGGLSTTGASTFSQCNGGAKITTINWTFASGSTPAGMAVEFSDVSDASLGKVASLAAGATSVAVPASIDASKIARIKFQFDGTLVKTFDFCFQKLTLSYQ